MILVLMNSFWAKKKQIIKFDFVDYLDKIYYS